MKEGFSGLPNVYWLPDGRKVKLAKSFAFTDRSGNEWHVPKGAIVDGSSIPRIFWRVVGSPFVGKHRNASIPHDYFCKLKEKSGRTHHEVHQMYYEACLSSGVGKFKAKIMHKAISIGGPKW